MDYETRSAKAEAFTNKALKVMHREVGDSVSFELYDRTSSAVRQALLNHGYDMYSEGRREGMIAAHRAVENCIKRETTEK